MKKIIFVFIGIIFLILSPLTFAAPAIEELALNHETKQCARFWSGDEFNNISLPAQWVSFPIINNYDENLNKVITDSGECTFTSYKECCEQLGYKYLEVDNIGTANIEDNSSNQSFTPIIISIIGMICVSLLVYFLRKKF